MKLVIGLGGIGGNLALRIADVGMAVVGLDPDAERVGAWTSQAARQGFTQVEEVPWREISQIMIAVRTEGQLDSVLRELSARLADQPIGLLVVSTISVARAKRLQQGLPESWRVIEAPVSGGEAAARDGRLTWFTHSPRRNAEDDGLIAALAGTEYRFDEPGQATFVKLLNNTIAAYNARGMALAVSLADDNNVPGDILREAIGNSSGASFAGSHLLDLSENQLDLLEKDIGLLGQEGATEVLVQQLQGWRVPVRRARAERVGDTSGL